LAGTPSIDIVLDAGSKLPAEDRAYDLVLSTQVLEHVLNPRVYLSEAFRVLREGGDVVLTTHGSFFDHSCPHDYFRWTAEGLRSSLEAIGFDVVSVRKLTVGPRALIFLLRHYEKLLLSPGFSWGSLFLRVLRLPFRLRPDLLDEFIDRQFPDYRICDGDQHKYSFYIALFAIARRSEWKVGMKIGLISFEYLSNTGLRIEQKSGDLASSERRTLSASGRFDCKDAARRIVIADAP
jgi:SAM-dependent methyltransferase